MCRKMNDDGSGEYVPAATIGDDEQNPIDPGKDDSMIASLICMDAIEQPTYGEERIRANARRKELLETLNQSNRSFFLCVPAAYNGEFTWKGWNNFGARSDTQRPAYVIFPNSLLTTCRSGIFDGAGKRIGDPPSEKNRIHLLPLTDCP